MIAHPRAAAWFALTLVALSAEVARADEPVAPPPATAPPPAAPPDTAPPPPPGAVPPAYPYPYPYPYPYHPYPQQPPVDPRPRVLPYVEGEPAPQGYRLESSNLRGAVIAGGILGGTTYGVNLLVASAVSAYSEESDWRLVMMYAPGLGTWGFVPDVCSEERGACSWLIIHSAAHTTGVLLFVYGLAERKQRYVLQTSSLTLAPVVGTSTVGLGLSGQF